MGVLARADLRQQQGQPKISRGRVSAVGKIGSQIQHRVSPRSSTAPRPERASSHGTARHPRSRRRAVGQALPGACQATVLPGHPPVTLGAPPPPQPPGQHRGIQIKHWKDRAGSCGAAHPPTHPPTTAAPSTHLPALSEFPFSDYRRIMRLNY